MFCKNCGSQISDKTKFCGKCGAAVQHPAGQRSRPSVPKSHGEHRGWQFPAFSPKALAAGGGVVLLILIVAGIWLGGRNVTSRPDGESTAEEVAAAGNEEQTHNDAALNRASSDPLKEDKVNSYTIEDLYGTWTDEGQTLTLTFEQDGTLRVADANNLIGVDVLKYKESNDHTLSLSAEQSGLLGIIAITMEYELSGDTLEVKLSGQEFVLTRK